MEGGWAGDIFSTSGLEHMRSGDSAVSWRSVLLDNFENLCAPQVIIVPVYLGLDRHKIGSLIVMHQPHNVFKNVVCHNELRSVHVITCWNTDAY